MYIDHHIETLKLISAELHRELPNCKGGEAISEMHEALNHITIGIAKLERIKTLEINFKKGRADVPTKTGR